MMRLKNNSTLLGSVQDVKGTSVSVQLNGSHTSGLTFVEGQGYRIGQVGSFVRIPIGYIDLFGIVSQVGARSKPENTEPDSHRWLTVQLIGEGFKKGKFQRGISQYPTIDDEVHLVSENDLARIYGEEGRQNHMVRVGHVAGSESIDALVDINKLITRHCAIVGTTGSGKSTTVAGLLNALSDTVKFPSARIIVLDIHGEYGRALQDRASIFKVNPAAGYSSERSLDIPYWAMSFDELIAITLGQIDDKDKGFVLEKITELKKKSVEIARTVNSMSYPGVIINNLNVDSPVPFSIHKLWLYLYRMINSTHTIQGTGQTFCSVFEDYDPLKSSEALQLDPISGIPIEAGDAERVIAPLYQTQRQQQIFLSGVNLNIRRSLDSLASKLRDPRYDFLFNPGLLKPDLNGQITNDLPVLIHDWIGSEKPITVLDLSGVPNSIMNSIIGILLRILYEGLFWARKLPEGGKEIPLMIVMEEAHSYLNDSNEGLASSIVQKIVKEGRKYGIGAMIVSQRPSEINPTILSQCGTFFSLRLSNQTDRSHIKGAITDNLEGLTDMLPILRTGEAIILGEAVKLPMRTMIEAPPKDRRPDSQDPVVCSELPPDLSYTIGGWDAPKGQNPDYNKFVEVWRKQNPTIVKSLKEE